VLDILHDYGRALTLDEVAAVMGISISEVWAIQTAALRRLREQGGAWEALSEHARAGHAGHAVHAVRVTRHAGRAGRAVSAPRRCAVRGCDVVLAPQNASGVCSYHQQRRGRGSSPECPSCGGPMTGLGDVCDGCNRAALAASDRDLCGRWAKVDRQE